MKVFTALYCCWEGDGHFVYTFEGNFGNLEDVHNLIRERGHNPALALMSDKLPEDPGCGDYGTPGFYHIYANSI